MLDLIADLAVKAYELNRKNLKIRGSFSVMRALGAFLPKLRRYPISFPGTGTHYADIAGPDAYWLFNAYVGDLHCSVSNLAGHLAARAKPGAVVWDIGGSMGLFTKALLAVAPDLAEVHLFEPHPIPRKVALDLLGDVKNVVIHGIALGDACGHADLFFGDGGTGGASFVNLDQGGESVTVKIETGDGMIHDHGLPGPDLMKIDVEGFEPNVLRGLKTAIAQKRPVIGIEILFLSHEVIQEILPEGYRIFYIRDSDGKLCEDRKTADLGGCMDALMEPIPA